MSAKLLKKLQAEQSACTMECAQVVGNIKNMILSGAMKPGTKLQSEKNLAENFSTTVYVIRQALKQLKAEGFLYSRPKHGVFVAGRNDQVTAVSESSRETIGFAPEMGVSSENRIRFVTQSSDEMQQALYRIASRNYQAKYPFFDVEILYSAWDYERSRPITMDRADVIEAGIPQFYHKFRHEMLPLNQYFSGQLIGMKEDPTAFPFCYTLRYLCYNPRLLAKIGCPDPSYRTFDEQTAYCRMVTEHIRKHDMPMPGLCFSMSCMLGDTWDSLLADLKDSHTDETAFVKKYMALFDRMTDYFREYHISLPRQGGEKMELFRQGKIPLFFCSSFNALRLRQCSREGCFAVYPFLTLDDKLCPELIPLSVHKNTQHTVESVKFIEHLQKDEETQRVLAEMGYLPLSEKHYSSLPFRNTVDRRCSKPIFFTSKDDYYVRFNILNVELCNIVLFDKTIENALQDTFRISRAYLSLQLGLQSQQILTERGAYFI